MSKPLKIAITFTSMLLVSCVNQNTKITNNLMPTTTPCTKLNLIQSAYHTDFDQLKETRITSSASNVWRAKYQLFGKDCQIFSWGAEQKNYSCRIVAPDELTAKKYYQNAKTVTQQCLGDDWHVNEENRKHDDGQKTTFMNNNISEKVSVSTHLVPTAGLFSTKWTIYYYVGNSAEPKNKAPK